MSLLEKHIAIINDEVNELMRTIEDLGKDTQTENKDVLITAYTLVIAKLMDRLVELQMYSQPLNPNELKAYIDKLADETKALVSRVDIPIERNKAITKLTEIRILCKILMRVEHDTNT